MHQQTNKQKICNLYMHEIKKKKKKGWGRDNITILNRDMEKDVEREVALLRSQKNALLFYNGETTHFISCCPNADI